jgi:hypothetical protein
MTKVSNITAGALFVRLFERFLGECPQIDESQCSFFKFAEREEDIFPRIIIRYKSGLRVMASFTEDDGVVKYSLGLRFEYDSRVDENRPITQYSTTVHWIYEITLDGKNKLIFNEEISLDSDFVEDCNENEHEYPIEEIHDMISRAMRTNGDSMRLDYYGLDSLQDSYEATLMDRIKEWEEEEEESED